MLKYFVRFLSLSIITIISAQEASHEFISKIVPISDGWAGNSINMVIFRRNSIISHNNHQYVAFYDDSATVILAKRHIDSAKWEIHKTQYKGNIKDAHNSISIMIDGDGYLHMAWDHHGNPLNYCKSTIPEGLELANKISMTTDYNNHPFIASYWTPHNSKIQQFHLVYNDGKKWQVQQITNRKTAFSLSGGGTKKIPISRPQILVDKNDIIYLIYRDLEQDNRVSLTRCNNLEKNNWTTADLTSFSVGQWEPTYDTELWNSENKLHLFIQNVGQGDAGQIENIPAQTISVLEWDKNK